MQAKKNHDVTDYASTQVNFGGEIMSRARAIAIMTEEGHSQKNIDRWLQGQDLVRHTAANGVSTIAQTILDQLGPMAMRMMGARQLVGDTRSLMFVIQGCKQFNKIRITLNGMDTYDVEFLRIAKTGKAIRHETQWGVYHDQLHGIIRWKTGLYLSL